MSQTYSWSELDEELSFPPRGAQSCVSRLSIFIKLNTQTCINRDCRMMPGWDMDSFQAQTARMINNWVGYKQSEIFGICFSFFCFVLGFLNLCVCVFCFVVLVFLLLLFICLLIIHKARLPEVVSYIASLCAVFLPPFTWKRNRFSVW